MPVELYPHNQTAYEQALHLMETSGRAAVVHPTGTGKSFIAFKLAEEHPDAKLIWLAPSEYIFRSQRDNYLAAGGEEAALSGITFLTYSKLLYGMSESEDLAGDLTGNLARDLTGNPIGDLAGADNVTGLGSEAAPDYIILDEFHRCGAESWGRCVAMLMEAYPKAKLLGLSATNIRYLDSRRDMAKELFDGQIASKMEVAEAIQKGILPAPYKVILNYVQ